MYVHANIRNSDVTVSFCDNTCTLIPVDATKKYTLHMSTERESVRNVQRNLINSGKSIGLIQTFNEIRSCRPISVKCKETNLALRKEIHL